ncbi:nickel pincer cofactor biosynthesis protein LarC2 [Natronospora cellulosivora (SeqCode)]
MNPEFYEYIMDKLLSAGALDVYLSPIQMKKNRPAQKLNVLIREKDKEVLSTCLEIIYTESSSLGIRVLEGIDRYSLDRKMETVDSPWGEVKVKVAYFEGSIVNIAPEYEDCRKIAEKEGLPLKEVYDKVKLRK